MAQEKMLSGCAAAAQGAKFAEVEVICSFPIRPYTAIMMELAKMVANGEIDAEFLHGEGEHAQVSVVLGASACGARAYTGSSGVGVTYAFEVYSPAAGGRYPLQMAIADRTLDPPGDFGSEHTDAMSARDQGWLMGWASTPQEVFDNTLINFRVGEDPKIMLPQFVCQDGYFLSHIPDKVVLPDIAQVREFLPPYAAPHPLSPICPVSHGPQIRPDQGAPMDAQRAATFLDLPPVIEKAVADYNAIFKRKMDPWLEKYMIDDAEIAFFIQGAHANTCKNAVRHLRAQGLKAGMVRPRWVRPWPTTADCGNAGPRQGGSLRRDEHVLRRRHEGRQPYPRGKGLPVRPRQETARNVVYGGVGRRRDPTRRLLLHGKDPEADGEGQESQTARLLGRLRGRGLRTIVNKEADNGRV